MIHAWDAWIDLINDSKIKLRLFIHFLLYDFVFT